MDEGCVRPETATETALGLRDIGNPRLTGLDDLPRPIGIHKAYNGYVVQVGCKTVVFETSEKMLAELKRYLENPAEVEKEYAEKYK